MNFDQKKNTKALSWTIGIHSLLLLIFILCKYTLPAVAKTEDMGMEVNLGTSDNGSGTDQPEAMDDPAAANAATTSNAASASDNNEREIHTTEDDDAPAVTINRPKPDVVRPRTQPANNTNSRTRATSNTPSHATTTVPAQSPRYVYAGATGKGGNSAQQNTPGGSEGIGTGEGDMGVPGGTPGASNYSGTPGMGGGSSIRVSIAGRSLVNRPDPKAEFKEGGQVVIHVTVNRDGVITNSRVVRAANATIRALALKKLASVKFNQSSSAPAEQFGDITFEFRATRR